MSRSKKLIHVLSGFLFSMPLALFMMVNMSITAIASDNISSSKEYLDTLNVGVASILDSDSRREIPKSDLSKKSTVSGNTTDEKAKKQEKKKSDLVMADVQNALNVRAEASEDSEKVGLLYKDCGGKILEQKDGWTKMQSGDLIGWAKDEYLLFDKAAEGLAEEVGNLIVTIETDALRVRKEPSTDAGIYVVMAQDDELDVIEVIDKEWISVEYENEVGYVSAEFVDMDFHIDAGETVKSIKAREKAEAEAKAS